MSKKSKAKMIIDAFLGFKFSFIAGALWMSFMLWSFGFVKDCVKGIYNGCQNSSGFIESFNVLNTAAMVFFIPLLVICILIDSTPNNRS